ncbi:MAG: hypothetical protein ABR520_11405, partial [Mycobacteriales bacterium]
PYRRQTLVRAIEAGPGTDAWVAGLLVINAPRYEPPLHWEAEVARRIAAGEQSRSWWSRNRPYLCAIAIGMAVGVAFAVLALVVGWL